MALPELLIITGAAGLRISMPPQLVLAASVLVQSAGVVTVLSHVATSLVVGPFPVVQLVPRSRVLLLFAFVTFAAEAVSADSVMPAASSRNIFFASFIMLPLGLRVLVVVGFRSLTVDSIKGSFCPSNPLPA